MDGEGRERAVSAFLLLRECPRDVEAYLEPHYSLTQVQAARDALALQEEAAVAAGTEAVAEPTAKVAEDKRPSKRALHIAYAITALLEHNDMFAVDLDARTAEAARGDVHRDATTARAAHQAFDAGVAQLRSIAHRAVTHEVVVHGLPELAAAEERAMPIESPAAA